MLKVENIKKKFDNKDVLKGIDLEIKEGTVTALIGASGSGKSTLLRCINCLVEADEGRLTMENKQINLDKISKEEILFLRRNTAMVFQNFYLFNNKNVIENITEALIYVKKYSKDKANELALSILERIGLSDKAYANPAQLSGGQQQRVAIGRAIALEPKVLLMDEPTSALDPELIQEVLLLIKELANQNQTMLVVTHEINFARNVADQICFLDEGYIIERGPAKDLVDHPQNPRTQKFLSKINHKV